MLIILLYFQMWTDFLALLSTLKCMFFFKDIFHVSKLGILDVQGNLIIFPTTVFTVFETLNTNAEEASMANCIFFQSSSPIPPLPQVFCVDAGFCSWNEG